MKDVEIILENKPGTLALLGNTLGSNGISLEGGGVFGNGETSIAHFLVEEAAKAKEVLERAGIAVKAVNDVIIQKLRQDVPGQLGLFCSKMAGANINILVQYSDHNNRLILVVDKPGEAKEIAEEWMKEWWNK